MKINKQRILTFLLCVGCALVVLLLSSCGIVKHTPRQVQTPSSNSTAKQACEQVGTIELSPDCGIVLRMHSGDSYQVTRIDDVDFSFTPGMKVQVSLSEEKDVIASCSDVRAAVRVICIEEIPVIDPSEEVECLKTNDVLQVPWMNRIIARYNPATVSRYIYGEDYAFAFEGKFGMVLYNCRGEMLCRTDYGDPSSCHPFIEQMRDKEVLLKVDY